MKSFKQYITEKTAKLSATYGYKGAQWDDFRGYENPSEKEMCFSANSDLLTSSLAK